MGQQVIIGKGSSNAIIQEKDSLLDTHDPFQLGYRHHFIIIGVQDNVELELMQSHGQHQSSKIPPYQSDLHSYKKITDELLLYSLMICRLLSYYYEKGRE